MSKIVLPIVIILTISIVILSCGDDEPTAPQVTAPEVLSISPITGTIGSSIALTITGIGFTETIVTSDDDDLVLNDTQLSDTEIIVTATISVNAFSKTVFLILTNTEGTDSVSFSLVPASLAGLVWSTVQDIPTPRSGLSVVAVDEKIYAIGGVNASDSIVATMEIFDPSTNTWTTGADMPAAVAFTASAVIDGKIYIAGGFNWITTFSTLNEYDPSTDTWTNLADMPRPRYAAGGAGFDGKFYVAGGVNDFFIGDFLESYDVANSNWITLTRLPRVKALFGFVPTDDKIFAMGGEGENNPGANFYFNLATESWSTSTELPTPRISPMADNFLGNVIVIGGRTADNTTEHTILVLTSTVESLNPSTNSWSTLTDIPDTRDRGGVAVIRDKIYIVGGRNRIDRDHIPSASTLVGEIP